MIGVTLGDATFEDTDASFDSLSVSGDTSLVTLTVSATSTFGGPLVLSPIPAPSVTTNTLYNLGGDLYWAGNLLSGSAIGNWASDGTNVWRAGGNVGIGTSSPMSELAVEGDVNVTGSIVTNGQSSRLFIGGGGVTHLGFGWGNAGYHSFHTSGGLNDNLALDIVDSANHWFGITGNTKIFYGLTVGYSALATPLTNNLLVADNVGIGTTSPYAKLSVTNTGTGPSFVVEDQDNDITPFLISATGNIGIGTTTPSHKLTVLGDVYASSFIDDGITLTAPDYVFDDPNYFHLSLADIEASTIANAHLPWLTPRGSGPMALSERINEILEALENLFLHVFDLAKRLVAVEENVYDLEEVKVETDDRLNEQSTEIGILKAEIAELEAKLEALSGAGETPQPEPASDESATPPAIEEDQPEEDTPSTAPAQDEEELGAVEDEQEPTDPEPTAPPA